MAEFSSPFLTAYLIFLFALLGACMGSFLNCLAWRAVHGESAFRGRSHCDLCGHTLTFGDLIPIVSYLVHGGKCRWCGSKISPRHLVCEILSAVVFVAVFLRFSLSWLTAEYLLWFSLLIAASFADLEAFIIPDRFVIAAIAVRLIFIFTGGNILPDLLNAALGGFAVALVLLLIVLVFEKIIGREAMGGGDIKLVFVNGLYLGWQKNLLCLFISCIVGILFAVVTQNARKDNEDARAFPFGPSIALAAFLAALFGDRLIAWYIGLFNFSL